MDKNSNLYLVSYAAIMTIIVAVMLSAISEVLKAPQQKNELLAQKKDILKSVGMDTVQDIEAYYAQHIKGIVINDKGEELEGIDELSINLKNEYAKPDPDKRRYPLFIYNGPGGEEYYIVPLRGFGLWGAIWGYVALENDLNTVKGVAFDHESETPGLGAEIKTDWFQQQFVGKKIFDGDQFVGVIVKKGKIDDPSHEVKSISGATMTSNGLTKMIQDGLKVYLPYFEKLKKES